MNLLPSRDVNEHEISNPHPVDIGLGEGVGIVDYSFFFNTNTYTPRDKSNSMKEELGIALNKTVDLNALMGYDEIPKITPARTILNEMDIHKNGIALFASIQMQKGIVGKDLIKSIVDRFPLEKVSACQKQIKELVEKKAGIVGCVAIDTDEFKNCTDAKKLASKSPYKKYIKYAFKKTACGNCVHCTSCKTKVGSGSANDNATDAFFASENSKDIKTGEFCNRLGMRLISRDELPEEDVSKNYTNLIDPVSAEEKEEIKKAKTAAEKIQKIFVAHNRYMKTKDIVIASKVEDDEYKLSVAEMKIDAPAALDEVEIQPEQRDVGEIDDKQLPCYDTDMDNRAYTPNIIKEVEIEPVGEQVEVENLDTWDI